MSGVYSNGSAGEFHAQTEDEFDRISELLAEVCSRAGTPFQIGASHMSAQISRRRLQRARALRPSAFQVVLPDWFPLTWSEIVAFLGTLAADADPIPLIVYNPPHAKRQVEPGEWLRIAESVTGVAGIKVAGGDDDWFEAMRPVAAKPSVFVPGHALASGLDRGAHGSYSNVACLSPRGAQQWYDLCLRDLDEGLRRERRIQRFWRQHVAPLVEERGLSNMAADKAVAAAGGVVARAGPEAALAVRMRDAGGRGWTRERGEGVPPRAVRCGLRAARGRASRRLRGGRRKRVVDRSPIEASRWGATQHEARRYSAPRS